MSLSLFSLKGKTVLITGGHKGIGLGLARGLADAEADLILVHRSTTDVSKAILELESQGSNVETIQADLENDLDVDTVLQNALLKSRTGKIDVLFNNAGISSKARAEEFPDELWNKTLQINLTSIFRLSRAFGKHWISEGQKGKIINTASLWSLYGGLNCVAYTASKGALHTLTKSLSNDWAGRGINVNSIIPGFIDTDMTKGIHDNPERYNELIGRIPQKKFGKPDDFRGVAVFLASDASNYITGTSIVVDGGFTGY